MDNETREWLEGFEKRMDAKIDHLEGWLKGTLDEMRCDIRGLDVKMDEGFAQIRRDINDLDRRVARIENGRPAFVG